MAFPFLVDAESSRREVIVSITSKVMGLPVVSG